jgi:hypothetical protein
MTQSRPTFIGPREAETGFVRVEDTAELVEDESAGTEVLDSGFVAAAEIFGEDVETHFLPPPLFFFVFLFFGFGLVWFRGGG